MLAESAHGYVSTYLAGMYLVAYTAAMAFELRRRLPPRPRSAMVVVVVVVVVCCFDAPRGHHKLSHEGLGLEGCLPHYGPPPALAMGLALEELHV